MILSPVGDVSLVCHAVVYEAVIAGLHLHLYIIFAS